MITKRHFNCEFWVVWTCGFASIVVKLSPIRRIQLKKQCQLFVNRWFFAFEGHRSFKENFNCHREKLFRSLRAVGIEYRSMSRMDMLNVALICLDEHVPPVSEILAPIEDRDAVGAARQVVDLVGELVKYDVVAVFFVDGILFGMLPGKNDRTP